MVETGWFYSHYYKAGGLEAILPKNGLTIKSVNAFANGAFYLAECTGE